MTDNWIYLYVSAVLWRLFLYHFSLNCDLCGVAYNEQGKKSDAKKIITDFIEQNLQLMFTAISSACLYADETDTEVCLQKYSALFALFEAEKYYPEHLLKFYYAMSIMYCNTKNKEVALNYFFKFTALLEHKIHDKNEIQFSDKMILETVINFTAENKAFRILYDEEQYNEIINQLKKLLEEYNG